MRDTDSSIERIGDFFVKTGIITPYQVVEILKEQIRQPGKLFGEIAVEMGYISDKSLDQYLTAKKESSE